MRPLFLSPALLLLAACPSVDDARPPPKNRFIFPSGIVHRDVPGSTHGALYVASANFDNCFDTGSVLALDLDKVGASGEGLPPLGQATGTSGPLQLSQLNVSDDGYVQIDSFAGEMALWTPQGRDPRLFVVTRSLNNYLHAIDVGASASLRCAQNEGRNCLDGALSLSAAPDAAEDAPSAAAPIGVTVAQDSGQVWVTHTEAAGQPQQAVGVDSRTYVVRVPADSLSVAPADYFAVGTQSLASGGTHAAAVGRRYLYVSGRDFTVAQGTARPATFLVRLVDRQQPGRVLDPVLNVSYSTQQARGLALNSDESRLYVVARGPDTLMVASLTDVDGIRPALAVVNAVPLSAGPSQLTVIPRPSQPGGPRRGDVVAITSSNAGVVTLYDEEVGQVVAQVSGVGVQPYGISADVQGNAARLFVTNFGDGRVAIIDIPNLDSPQDARLVAHLGTQLERDPQRGTTICQENQQ